MRAQFTEQSERKLYARINPAPFIELYINFFINTFNFKHILNIKKVRDQIQPDNLCRSLLLHKLWLHLK
jgi:hypothetical protein